VRQPRLGIADRLFGRPGPRHPLPPAARPPARLAGVPARRPRSPRRRPARQDGPRPPGGPAGWRPARLVGHQFLPVHRPARAARARTSAVGGWARLPAPALAALLFGTPGLCWRAHVGTATVREPARLPRELQARLCEFLATPPPGGAPARRPRLIAGCTADPAADVRSGALLEELYCALSTLTIAVPPLRERPADLHAFVRSVLERLNTDRTQPITD